MVFIDATHYSVRDNGVVRKLAAYVILAIDCDGRKDILILCADGLTGLKDAVATAFPQTEFQRCIVHQVRNTLKYVATKDRKNFTADLKKFTRHLTSRLLPESATRSTPLKDSVRFFVYVGAEMASRRDLSPLLHKIYYTVTLNGQKNIRTR